MRWQPVPRDKDGVEPRVMQGKSSTPAAAGSLGIGGGGGIRVLFLLYLNQLDGWLWAGLAMVVGFFGVF